LGLTCKARTEFDLSEYLHENARITLQKLRNLTP
jgi:hypothetical protein